MSATRLESTLATFLKRWQWFVVAALCLVALWIRVVPRFYWVFQPGFVNFQETDAWYHVRVAENLIRHFPWRISVDPYLTFGHVNDAATAPAYDWLLGLIAWVAGAGSPSESTLHVIAAWYPAILGSLIVAVVFALGRFVFGLRTALIAAAVVATLPGHFLRVSSLGFTDHHVMESLLAALFFFLLLRAMGQSASLRWTLAAGVTLAAYLLTFHGAALLPGVVVVWAVYDRVRSLWPREKPAPSLKPLYLAFLMALCVCLIFRRLLWMNYTIATLVLGIVAVAALDAWRKWGGRVLAQPRLPIYAVAATASVAFVAGVLRAPGFRHLVKHAAARFLPGLLGAAAGVYELASPIYKDGHFTLAPALEQFYGAYFFALAGLFLLSEVALKRAEPGKALLFFWSLAMFILAMGQLRMTYYYAVAAALLTGYAADGLLASGRKTAWTVCACLALFVFAPNIYAVINRDEGTGISEDWKEALDWMRTSTPEPFGDPGFYYARYDRQQFGPNYRYPASAYSVMAWWDYGYWIMNVGRRIPVTNPTQANADVAADFFLSQSEGEAAAILRDWRTRYVALDERLPLWPSSDAEKMLGDYPQFFEYSRKHRRDDYLLVAYQRDAAGKLTPKAFYRPAYYRSIVVRLFVFGGKAADGHDGATILSLQQKTFPHGGTYQEITGMRQFGSAQEAAAAENGCRSEGCVLVGENPMIPCVPVEPLQQFRPVFASTTSVVGFGESGAKAVQVYEFVGASR